MAEWPANNLPAGQWVDLFEEAGFTRDGKPVPRPQRPVTLYRGCHHERRFGMSWTTDRAQAEWFVGRNLGRGVGRIYTHRAGAVELLAYIHESGRRENEYVLDSSVVSHQFGGSTSDVARI